MADEATSFEKLDETARGIIRNHMYGAVGVGLIPVPIVDLVGLVGLQVNMLANLAKAYDVEFRKDWGKSAVGALIGGVTPLTLAMPLASVLKVIPLVGQTTAVLSLSIAGGGLTYAVGTIFAQHFASGGNLLNFNPEAAREIFKARFEEGKAAAREAKN